MKNLEAILDESTLKITQDIESIKTLALPISEFPLRHSNLSLNQA
jgi:hypothetical protein